ncbi:M20/M25/M40 family metallo-hydrolase [Metabacillus iocasae]|uniref:Arginine utilization protein RocB n=1 Tax=Priestia iocasae TaxID=2291674 RepID=A0ABS2QVE3_9BACI|nr:M20/M25/M40 family metallo-hydrolase [Metabacillus iocasae]MBM7703466.1 arginine utilization protein RocB [Metabacillus iocasae]
MYEQIKDMTMAAQIETVTRKLIEINSINGTKGEVELANFIKETLLTFPYFQKNPSYVWEQLVPNDSIGRKNVFAFVKGFSSSEKTVVYHAHIDTVGVQDFGSLQPYAFDSDALEAYFKQYEYDQDVKQDAHSGDWLFGRGSVDMQSGIAVHLVNVLHFTQNIGQLPGNLLFMANPDEESQHKGVIASLTELKRLQVEKQLDYIVAINTDFITPLYDGDTKRYIYTGAAGKLLPSFYIYGRETHVGDTLSGIDPTYISSEINRRINNNIELAENIPGELILPPSCLYQKDEKDVYNVQTAKRSFLYFNYFIYESTAKEVMEKLKQVAVVACQEVEANLASNYQEFSKRTGLPPKRYSWSVEVTSLAEFIEELTQKGIDVDNVMKEVILENEGLEVRELSFKMVEALQQLDPDKKPRVIIFYAPPYLPHNYLNEHHERDWNLARIVKESMKFIAQETGEQFELKRFFPYLADGSFLSIHETDEEIASLIENFPEMSSIFPLPIREMRELNIPSVNMGVYGKDGHKWTERVYKPYSFDVLPRLIRETSIAMLGDIEGRTSETG